MNTLYRAIIISIFAIMCFSGQALAQTAPECSSPQIKELVITVSEDAMRNSWLKRYAADEGMGFTRKIEYPEFKAWADTPGEDPRFAKIIDKIDGNIANANVSLTAIRTEGIREDVDKHFCAAFLLFAHNGNELPITYTSQLTDGGNGIVVAVSGL